MAAIYLEVHPHLEEDEQLYREQYSHVVKLVLDRVKAFDVQLVWSEIKRAIELKNGIPHKIGTYQLRSAAQVALNRLPSRS